ncbi:MAG: hypothetical protein HOB17_00755 [Candidatus Marinimicrobia bacterium]|nr:hypothetical protein [Candidatus Neomarinimicrobiota bacterium]MBT3633246.1 hypothetical protein [Candidatus Neomarinimicrobiota bacterium]MBT3682153.1 hypothetical protein [Candidatus Neomarinimicrobiota bacterium]MBT3758846.1 hypothetical protein [Candidatus Neomarinimicrobiota bacterium]MBT3895279.1 hypothetical protein [Candidatus Neomarinimicrobiota bacterium]
MKINKHTFIIFIVCFSFSWMQSLEDEWGKYLSINSKLQVAISKNQKLNINKESLFIKKQEIKQNQAWYNGWISEIKLTNINNSLVEISDSLIVIQNRIETLQDTKNTSMQIIKDKYNTYMLIADAPSMEENRLEFVINLSKLLDVSGFNSLPLPDYNSLIKNIWSDKKMKQLIYDDLLLILHSKLSYIDSILVEKEKDLTLLKNIQDFHSDVDLQLSSDNDIISTNLGEEYLSDIIEDDESFIDFDAVITDIQVMENSHLSPSENVKSLSLTPQNNIERDVLLLAHKRLQYKILIDEMMNELSQ